MESLAVWPVETEPSLSLVSPLLECVIQLLRENPRARVTHDRAVMARCVIDIQPALHKRAPAHCPILHDAAGLRHRTKQHRAARIGFGLVILGGPVPGLADLTDRRG